MDVDFYPEKFKVPGWEERREIALKYLRDVSVADPLEEGLPPSGAILQHVLAHLLDEHMDMLEGDPWLEKLSAAVGVPVRELPRFFLIPHFSLGDSFHDVLVVKLISKLSETERRKISHVPIIYLETIAPTGYAIKLPDGDSVIVLDSRLDLLALGLLQLAFAGFAPSTGFANMENLAEYTLRYFHAESFADHKAKAEISSDLLDLLGSKMQLLSPLGDLLTGFFIAHELGHVLRGHLDTETKVSSEAFPGASVEVHQMNFTMEYEADLSSLELLHRHLDGWDLSAAADCLGCSDAGEDCVLLFVIAVALAAVHFLQCAQRSLTPSHPSALKRFEELLASCEGVAAEHERFARHVFDFFAEMTKRFEIKFQTALAERSR